MDIIDLLKNTKGPAQVVGRLSMIRTLQRDRRLRLSQDDLEQLIDRCIEICNKDDIKLDIEG